MGSGNESIERLVVATVKAVLTASPLAPRTAVHAALTKVGMEMTPFELDLLLRRHPVLFRLNHRAEWRLA